jgi:hypothetical protein
MRSLRVTGFLSRVHGEEKARELFQLAQDNSRSRAAKSIMRPMSCTRRSICGTILQRDFC